MAGPPVYDQRKSNLYKKNADGIKKETWNILTCHKDGMILKEQRYKWRQELSDNMGVSYWWEEELLKRGTKLLRTECP